MALKDLKVRALKARDRVYKRGDGYGLYIEVHPNGSKLWRLKYSHLGKDKRIVQSRPDGRKYPFHFGQRWFHFGL